MFWLNAAETWVDIKKDDQNAGLLGSMFGSSEEKESAVHAHFMSEAGVIDAFVLLGPSPADVSTQYASLTGPTPLPPMFSIGSLNKISFSFSRNLYYQPIFQLITNVDGITTIKKT